jgi:hypothetical protein
LDISQRARHDLARLDEQIARLQEHLSRAEQERRRLEDFIERAERYGEELKEEEETRRSSKAARIRELATTAISDADRALTIHEIVSYVEAHGEEINSKDKTSYVSALLSRDRRFSFARDKGWSVLRPLPRKDLLAALERLQTQGASPPETHEDGE